MAEDSNTDDPNATVEILDVSHGGVSVDSYTVSLTLSAKGNRAISLAMPVAIAEKLIMGTQAVLTKNAELRTGLPSKIFGSIIEPSSIAAKAAPDGSHAVLVFEASAGPRANIRLEPADLKRVRQELKRIEEQLRRLRMKH